MGRRKILINKGVPPQSVLEGFLKERDTCPNLKNHLYGPYDYLAWHAWAERIHKLGYEAKRCPDCGFYLIYKLKRKK